MRETASAHMLSKKARVKKETNALPVLGSLRTKACCTMLCSATKLIAAAKQICTEDNQSAAQSCCVNIDKCNTGKPFAHQRVNHKQEALLLVWQCADGDQPGKQWAEGNKHERAVA